MDNYNFEEDPFIPLRSADLILGDTLFEDDETLSDSQLVQAEIAAANE